MNIEKPRIDLGMEKTPEDSLKSNQLEANSEGAIILNILEIIKRGELSQVSKEYSLEQVINSMNELIKIMDGWVDAWYSEEYESYLDNDDIFNPEVVIEELNEDLPEDIIDMFNSDNTRKMIELCLRMGYDKSKIKVFFESKYGKSRGVKDAQEDIDIASSNISLN